MFEVAMISVSPRISFITISPIFTGALIFAARMISIASNIFDFVIGAALLTETKASSLLSTLTMEVTTLFGAVISVIPYVSPRLQVFPVTVIVPSFMISELKRAFQMGFLIYIPFLVIDIVVGSTLMSMGMMMLPPAMISMPFKILIFVLADGWNLLIGSVVSSYNW